MKISSKSKFINKITSFHLATDYVVVKPNWVSIQEGEYTKPEILEWLFEALPQKKIVIESYTPWRGLECSPNKDKEELKVDLVGGKKFWNFYRKQDEYFLKETGMGKVLEKFGAKYINSTNEFWKGNCVDWSVIKSEVEKKFKDIHWTEFYSYIPKQIYQIRKNATLISLAKIKLEEKNKYIVVSLSIKNLFGLIPHPSRKEPFHTKDHSKIPQVTADMFKVYYSLFPNSLWINEGIKTLVKNYCEEDQFIERGKGLFFIGTDPVKVDSETCSEFGINPSNVPYLDLIKL